MADKQIFSVYILEDEDGSVRVLASSQGVPGKAFEVGLEIMANLKAAECEHPDLLTVSPIICSEFRQ